MPDSTEKPWYTLSDEEAQAIDVDNRSLMVAYGNLAQRFGIALPALPVPTYHADWWSIPLHEDIELMEVGQAGWPPFNDAIVWLRRIDQAAGGMIDHFCLVHDWHMIIDSLDGSVQPAGIYGEVLGWATFKDKNIAIIADPAADQEPPKPGTTYKWVEGDILSQVARRLGIRPLELLEHNDITDPRTIKPGDVLHLPVARQMEPENGIKIELLPEPRLMHIKQPHGARKWLFGNAKQWSDLSQSGPTLTEGTNVAIHAIAHVPLDGETVDFYMEQVALGSYATTGLVAYTLGFSPNHLDDGHVDKPKRKTPEPPTLPPAVEESEPEPEPVVAAAEPADPYAWKSTIRPLYDDRRVVRMRPVRDMQVHELEGRGEPYYAFRDETTWLIRCVFDKDGVTYALPIDHETDGKWWDIPTKLLSPMEVTEKPYTLTATDRTLWIPLAWLFSRYMRLFGKKYV